MLNCEFCDYFKKTSSKAKGGSKHMCEFTGFVFHKKVEDYEMENHPCFDYQIKKNSVESDDVEILTNENLKLA